MIDIPLNKALVVVEGKCSDCYFYRIGDGRTKCGCKSRLACEPNFRKDGKDVIFKLVDLPEGRDNELTGRN